MKSRGRDFNQSNNWDDYDNTDDQAFGDDDGGMNQLDQCRLYITNIPKTLNEDGLRTAFSKYGVLIEAHVSKDPLKRYGLVSYETPGEAKLAMMKLNKTEPLRFNIAIAHKKKTQNNNNNRQRDDRERRYRDDSSAVREGSSRDDVSVGSRGRSMRKRDLANGDNDMDNVQGEDELELDADLHLELEQLKLEHLKLQEEQLMCKHRMLLLKQAEKRTLTQGTSSNRCILPDGRIVVRTTNERAFDSREAESSFGAGAGDSNERKTECSCKPKCSCQCSSDGSSTPSTCVLCSDEKSETKDKLYKYDKYEYSSNSKTADVACRSVLSKTTDCTSKRCVATKKIDKVSRKSEITCDMKYDDFYNDSDDEDETNRLIQLRNSDYMDIVDDTLKIVIALAGYPKSKMRLKQMELFQKCLSDVIDMQLKAGLLKKVPSFLDYYLNRGALVCVCKDMETRDWMVRINPGLQERMANNLILLKAKVKRLCLAVMKIPRCCWPATAQESFKLLQYFNPTLKTDMWKIYAQKIVDDVECTSFLIDRVSGEIIRGPNFKNVIDYSTMEFEVTGYTEIYYECLLSDSDEDLSSVASRVKLLEELKSTDVTPRNASDVSLQKEVLVDEKKEESDVEMQTEMQDEMREEVQEVQEIETAIEEPEVDVKKELESSLPRDVLKKLKDVEYISDKDEVIVWSDETNNYNSDQEEKTDEVEEFVEEPATTSAVAMSDKTDSILGSNDNLISRNSNVNIDSNRGIAYHRRTNYLHVENELKIAITLEGYPQNKLEGTHIRRLKHLFKEYLHKDMKNQRFANLIIPKFQDIYLSNGAVIYICDSLETKDYLTEVLPKFVNSTGLKLTFRDVKNLVRYTRIVMRLPKEQAHIESMEILQKLQANYPGLKPDCWKYYSDVAGKQKRQFGVDPESLEVIKSPDFDPVYEGEKLSFRIIDRQKRDVSFEGDAKTETIEDSNTKKLKEKVLKLMYVSIDADVMNAPLTRIRTNHYSDLIPDDLKLYVGPSNYPETRVEETLFHTIKRTFENILVEALDKGEINEDDLPKFHDMYLFDGVIFIICQSMVSRHWVENVITSVNSRLHIHLKSTEFRGAVGIISMVLKTDKDTDDVIGMLQKQNPRLRTKYWRKISTVRTKTKLDAVLQIDKLSAQVITSPSFNKFIDGNAVQFKLGHLQSLLKPKATLEALSLKSNLQCKVKSNKSKDIDQSIPDNKTWTLKDNCKSERVFKTSNNDFLYNTVIDPYIIEPETPNNDIETDNQGHRKMILKIPLNILPENKEDLNVIFDLLEDKNPGLNTELWQVTTKTYPNSGKFIVSVDRQSATVIQNNNFDPTIGGEKLRFFF